MDPTSKQYLLDAYEATAEVEIVEQGALQLPASLETADQRTALWNTCRRLAVKGNEMVPKWCWDRPEAMMTAIAAGGELGLSPFESLRKIYVVDGNPTLKGEELLALILRRGGKVRWIERSPERCVVEGVRPDGETMKVAWTMEMARTAGLANKNNWKNYPHTMLAWRALSELARFHFPDVTGWVSYVPEDFDETEDA